MSNLDWLFVALLSLAFVSGGLVLGLLFRFIQKKRQIKWLKNKKCKNKKSERVKKQKLQKILKEKKRCKKGLIVFLTVGIIASGSAIFGRIYQAHNLNEIDTHCIASGYGLLYLLNQSLTELEADKADAELNETVNQLARKFSSFGSYRGSPSLTEEGQLLLNRYYTKLAQLGNNLNQESNLVVTDATTREIYQQELAAITALQSEVYELYNINEESLKKQVTTEA